MWTESTKGSRIHRGVEDNNRITESTRLATLSVTSNTFTRTVYMEANNFVTGTVTLQAMPVLNTNTVAGYDSVKINGITFGFQPYTPQTEPFQLWAIEERNWKENGVGIRRNTDFDNGSSVNDSNFSGTISNEDDLIKVRLDFIPVSGIQYVLRKDNDNLKLWNSNTKNTGYVFTNDECIMVTPGHVWAEYASDDDDSYTLTLVAINTDTNIELFTEEIVFKPFNSVIVILGGESQEPNDPVNHPGNHGIFDWAITQYREGYNIYMYNEDDCSGYGVGATYNDLVNSINNHYIQNIAIAGYSHGGGSTYGLSWRLNENVAGRINDITRSFSVVLTAYIDAIWDYTNQAENRRPLLSSRHVNYYQQNTTYLLGLIPLNGSPSGADAEHHIDPSGTTVFHSNIDDNQFVLLDLEDELRSVIIPGLW
jgi:hypothetical protein